MNFKKFQLQGVWISRLLFHSSFFFSFSFFACFNQRTSTITWAWHTWRDTYKLNHNLFLQTSVNHHLFIWHAWLIYSSAAWYHFRLLRINHHYLSLLCRFLHLSHLSLHWLHKVTYYLHWWLMYATDDRAIDGYTCVLNLNVPLSFFGKKLVACYSFATYGSLLQLISINHWAAISSILWLRTAVLAWELLLEYRPTKTLVK